MSSTTDTLNRIYADQMQNHPYGYALYQPALTSVIKPGVVGYFDPSGFWSPLADLSDAAGLKAAGLQPLQSKPSSAPAQNATWGPMTSKNVSGENFQASPSLGPAATGLPLQASVQIKYTTSSSFGAVLVTAPPVTHEAFYYQSPYQHWVAANAHALLSGEHKDDIHANGLVVVTQTYSTSKASLTAWTDGKSDVFLGFNAQVPGVTKVDPSGGWYTGNSAGGWEAYTGTDTDKMVVFIGGVWYDCQKEGLGSLFRLEEPSAAEGQPAKNTQSHSGDHEADKDANSVKVENAHGEKYHLKAKVWGQPLPQKTQ